MRSVSEIKKFTAIKDLHPSLVPKWSSTSQSSPTNNDNDKHKSSPSTDTNTDNLTNCDNEFDEETAVKTNVIDSDRDKTSETSDSVKNTEKKNPSSVVNVGKVVVAVEEKPVRPKIVYFFERGDSLKQELGEENVNGKEDDIVESSDKVNSLSSSKHGVKRPHDGKVRIKKLIL
jgi:hypothetical protein